MADETRDRQDRDRKGNSIVPDAEPATNSERDFGKTDRYANQDQGKNFNVRNIGDGTVWDTGRDAAITDGTRGEAETRAADAETPGVQTRPASDALNERKRDEP